MKRLCLMASLVLFNACGPDDEHRLFVRLVNGTNISQKVVVDGSIQRKGLDGKFPHTLTFNQMVTAPAQGEQRVSVLDPIYERGGDLILYEEDLLSLKAFSRNGLIVGVWEDVVLDHDVECRIVREGSDPDGNEGSLECSTQPPPPDEGDGN